MTRMFNVKSASDTLHTTVKSFLQALQVCQVYMRKPSCPRKVNNGDSLVIDVVLWMS